MDRRLLPALANHNNGIGAFATKWERWIDPHDLSFEVRHYNKIGDADGIDDRVEEAMGVYAVLYEASPGSRYVVYVGYSADLRRELKTRYHRWEEDGLLYPRKSSYPFAALYIPSQKNATRYEDYLIRYYCPPWNTRFSRQPHRPQAL
jgi:hypothetical protein